MQRHHPVQVAAELVQQLAHGPQPRGGVVGIVGTQPLHDAPRGAEPLGEGAVHIADRAPAHPDPRIGGPSGVDHRQDLLHPGGMDLLQPGAEGSGARRGRGRRGRNGGGGSHRAPPDCEGPRPRPSQA